MKKVKFFGFALLLALLVPLVLPVLSLAASAVQEQPPAVPTLVEFLGKIASGGVLGVIVAFLLEYVPAFQRLSPDAKKWTVFGIFIVLPPAATALLQFVPVPVWDVLEPFWAAIAVGFVMWLGSQVAHQWDKKRDG